MCSCWYWRAWKVICQTIQLMHAIYGNMSKALTFVHNLATVRMDITHLPIHRTSPTSPTQDITHLPYTGHHPPPLHRTSPTSPTQDITHLPYTGHHPPPLHRTSPTSPTQDITHLPYTGHHPPPQHRISPPPLHS